MLEMGLPDRRKGEDQRRLLDVGKHDILLVDVTEEEAKHGDIRLS